MKLVTAELTPNFRLFVKIRPDAGYKKNAIDGSIVLTGYKHKIINQMFLIIEHIN